MGVPARGSQRVRRNEWPDALRWGGRPCTSPFAYRAPQPPVGRGLPSLVHRGPGARLNFRP